MQYGATIFQSAGIADPILVQLVLGAVNVVMTFPGLYIVERLGRRIPLIVGACWQAAWLLIFAAVGIARPPDANPASGIVMIVAACMFIASFAMTWYVNLFPVPAHLRIFQAILIYLKRGPFAWVVIGETFPLRTRAKQASLATASNWLGNFMISFLTPFADSGIGYAFGFVFFGTNAAAALLTYFFLYETKSLALEQVDVMYSQRELRPWQSSKWNPEGYLTRNKRDPAYFNERRGSVIDEKIGGDEKGGYGTSHD